MGSRRSPGWLLGHGVHARRNYPCARRAVVGFLPRPQRIHEIGVEGGQHLVSHQIRRLGEGEGSRRLESVSQTTRRPLRVGVAALHCPCPLSYLFHRRRHIGRVFVTRRISPTVYRDWFKSMVLRLEPLQRPTAARLTDWWPLSVSHSRRRNAHGSESAPTQ
jgi:hypothetical protein